MKKENWILIFIIICVFLSSIFIFFHEANVMKEELNQIKKTTKERSTSCYFPKN